MPGYTGGDFARLYYLMREFPDKKKEAILTVVMDRLIGMAALVLTALLTTILRWQLAPTDSSGDGLAVGSDQHADRIRGDHGIGSFAVTGFKLVDRLPEHFPFRDRLVETSEAYHLFARAKKSLLFAFLLSFPVLFSFYGAFYCTAKALGAGVSVLDMCSIMPIVTAIISLPITPSGIGFRESLLGILLNDLCNVPTEIGVLISLLGFAYFVFFGDCRRHYLFVLCVRKNTLAGAKCKTRSGAPTATRIEPAARKRVACDLWIFFLDIPRTRMTPSCSMRWRSTRSICVGTGSNTFCRISRL